MGTHTLLSHPAAVNVRISNCLIYRVNEVKSSGILIDNDLKCKAHKDEVKTRVSKLVGVIYRIKGCSNQDNIKQIYLFNISIFHLLCSNMGGTYQTQLQSLFITKKKILRIMFNLNYLDHTNQHFLRHNLVN